MKKRDKLLQVLDFNALVLIFSAGSFIGYAVEMLYCYAKKGFFESKQGMVLGPFNQIYGFGAIIMTVVLVPLANEKKPRAFALGMILGGAFEFACSLLQELWFGTRSWDFSAKTLNIMGRTGLVYMMFWGLLGVLFVSYVYPPIVRFVAQIPKKIITTGAWVLVVFFVLNMAVSCGAVLRWKDRQIDQSPADTAVWQFFDRHFPDDRMQKIYPTMYPVNGE